MNDCLGHQTIGDVSTRCFRCSSDAHDLEQRSRSKEIEWKEQRTWPRFKPKYRATGSPNWIRGSWLSFNRLKQKCFQSITLKIDGFTIVLIILVFLPVLEWHVLEPTKRKICEEEKKEDSINVHCVQWYWSIIRFLRTLEMNLVYFVIHWWAKTSLFFSSMNSNRSYFFRWGCETLLNNDDRMSDTFIFHLLVIIFDFINSNFRLIGKLNDHRFSWIIVVCDHNNQLRTRWFSFTGFIPKNGFELIQCLIKFILTD